MTEPDTVAEKSPSRKRREINLATIEQDFKDLADFIENEIVRQRDQRLKAGGIKFLRSALKRTRQLQNDVRRVARKKNIKVRGGEQYRKNNSGFNKEVPITDEMADFLGLEYGSLLCRSACTKLLHQYIQEHNLKNPSNGREIFPDKALTTLLKYEKRKHGPLYYYVIQKLIQQHFVKTPAPNSVPTPAQTSEPTPT